MTCRLKIKTKKSKSPSESCKFNSYLATCVAGKHHLPNSHKQLDGEKIKKIFLKKSNFNSDNCQQRADGIGFPDVWFFKRETKLPKKFSEKMGQQLAKINTVFRSSVFLPQCQSECCNAFLL